MLSLCRKRIYRCKMKLKKYLFLLFAFLSYSLALAQVDTAWVRRYNGPANGNDGAVALAFGPLGILYVTGWSQGNETGLDYTTILYDPNVGLGSQLVRRFDGELSDDIPVAFVVDNDWNIYITGRSQSHLFPFPSYMNDDYVTIKYSKTGDIWVKHFDTGRNENPWAMAVDDSGNVYVSGSDGLIKYLPDGDVAWVKSCCIYGPVIVDGNGNIY